MISHITGKIKQKKENSLIIEINGIGYEVFIPTAILKSITQLDPSTDGAITLMTFHYLHSEPARSIPILIGFMNEIEKEFFEKFITVSGVGPKAALKALSVPISTIAEAIDSGNLSVLKSLPGIGEQRAREIVAKLQGKVGKFALIKDKVGSKDVFMADEGIKEEAVDILLQLQYTKHEAVKMVEAAFGRNPNVKNSEDILNEVYKQRFTSKNAR